METTAIRVCSICAGAVSRHCSRAASRNRIGRHIRDKRRRIDVFTKAFRSLLRRSATCVGAPRYPQHLGLARVGRMRLPPPVCKLGCPCQARRRRQVSEDCLYLNIWTPANNAHERLPVIVWIYGGG